MCVCVAVRRLWGSSRDHGEEVEEMLQEHAAQQGVRTHTVLEFLLERTLRWQLATVLVTFSALQLCGINAVSHAPPAPSSVLSWADFSSPQSFVFKV